MQAAGNQAPLVDRQVDLHASGVDHLRQRSAQPPVRRSKAIGSRPSRLCLDEQLREHDALIGATVIREPCCQNNNSHPVASRRWSSPIHLDPATSIKQPDPSERLYCQKMPMTVSPAMRTDAVSP